MALSSMLCFMFFSQIASFAGAMRTPPPPRPSGGSMTRWIFANAQACPPQYVAAVFLGIIVVSAAMPWTRYNTAADIPDTAYARHLTIKGEVVNVADGDSLRLRHAPFFSFSKARSGRLTETTIAVRLYGIDAPEMAKFGQPGQAYAAEAKDFVIKTLKGQNVKLTLLRRDQYGRAVGRVTYGTWPLRHDASEELLRRGLAVVYRGGGAEYDGRRDAFERLEAASKTARRGLWKASQVELPSDYKAGQRRAQGASRVPAAV
ncbi:unnamed protein product [Phaeothamnion confervicola]